MKVTNMTAGTLVRTVMLVVALLNLVLTSFGKNPLPFSDEQIYTGLSALVTVAAALAAWLHMLSPSAHQSSHGGRITALPAAPARQMRCCGCCNTRAPQRTRA